MNRAEFKRWWWSLNVSPRRATFSRGGFVWLCTKGHSITKVGQRRKGISKARTLTVSHILLWNILPREVAGTSFPFRGLKRDQQVVRTCPRRTGVILGGGLAKFAVTISHLKYPLFWDPFLSGICKFRIKKENSRRIIIPSAGCWGLWYNLWVSQRTQPQNIFPIQRHLLIPWGQVIILNPVI